MGADVSPYHYVKTEGVANVYVPRDIIVCT